MSERNLLIAGSLIVLWAGKAAPLLPDPWPPLALAGHSLLLLLWLVLLVRARAFAKLLVAGPWRWRWLGVGIALGMTLFLLGGVGYAVAGGVLGLEPPAEAAAVAGVERWGLLPLGTMVVAAAGVEEWLFRGVLVERLDDLTPWVAVLSSAALFAAYHLSLFQALPGFLLGVGLGASVLATGSLWPAVVAHATYNLLGVAAFALT